MVALAASAGIEEVTTLLAQVVGLALVAAALAGVAAFAYRWYVREPLPTGLGLLVGLSGVAVYLSTTTILGEVIGGASGPTDVQEALFNIVAFAGGTAGADVGRRVGDRLAVDVFSETGLRGVESDVGRLVKSVGRVIAVELPATIDDVVGYDPVSAETKEALAGKTLVFPRRLTVEELESRLVSRLKTDYAVGHVDVEFAEDGSVQYLALGSRAAGIGPTLPPATNAVAVRADPAFAASAGDLVQVWETDSMRRVLTAELRGVSGDVVTLAIDAADTPKVDPATQYRLVTLPVDDRPDREFASLLRAADETFSSVTVRAGSPLHGMAVGALSLTIISVKGEESEPTVLPGADHVIDAGDVVSAIARPEELRRLEIAGTSLSPSIESAVEPGAESGVATPSDDGTSPAEALAASSAESESSAFDETERAAGGTDDGQPRDSAEPGETAGDETGDSPTESKDEERGESAANGSDGNDESARGEADSSTVPEPEDGFETDDSDPVDVRDAAGDDDSGGEPASKESTERQAGGDLEQSGGDDTPDGTRDPADAGGAARDEIDDDIEDLGEDLADLGDDLDDLGTDLEDFDAGSNGTESGDEGGYEGSDGDEGNGDSGDGSEDGDGDEDDVDEGDSGGGASFAQLKEEFESGEADWEDDISDSPGGDMRLDE